MVPTMQEGKVLLGNFYASDGIGVHPSETSALLQILTGSQQAQANSQSEPQPQRSYRSILNSCLEEFLQDTDHPIEFASLELFKLMYAITHLTETHILRTPTMADTVSYLRHHHMETLLIQEFLETTSHPEEHEEYWTLLRKLVIRGCLSDAWSVLTYHSACQRAAMENPLSSSSSREIIASPYSNTNALAYSRERDRHGFAALREILETAPIPGGRTDLYDIEQNDGDDDYEEDMNNISTNLFKNKSFTSGVHQKDYQLWNTTPSAALATWRMWQSQVTSFSSVGGVGSFLLNREPRLIPLLQMMQGDLSSIPFEDWSEALCAELLYIRPNLRPEDLPVRLSRSMQRMGQTDSCSLILAILEGDYGAIVESLYTKLGGGSGAALPATMVCIKMNSLLLN
jgi:Nup85 Nucleoporin